MTRNTSVLARCLGVLVGGSALLTACGEPGSLMIVLGDVPRVTASTSVTVPGVVTRVPAKETDIVVTATGGKATATDTVTAEGTFAVSVQLTRDAEATITLTAEDGTGAVSPPVAVTVRQDLQPPEVTTFTPTGADVSTAPTVEVTFSEAVRLSGPGGMQLMSRGSPIAASALLSADSLTVTLSLGQLLSRNSAYVLAFPGVSDAAGNQPDASGSGACFVTANSAPAAVSQPDSTDDLWQNGTPTDPSPSDIDLVRLSLESDTLFGVMRFTTPRSFGTLTLDNNVAVYFDIDLDQDSTTGFASAKDSVFAGLDLSTGVGVEAGVWIDWGFSGFGDSAIAGQYVDFATITPTTAFLPDVCGRYVGFAVPFSPLGPDDGNFDYVLLAWNTEPATSINLIDPMPESGHNSVAFAGLFAGGVEPVAASGFQRRATVRSGRFPFR